MAVRSLKSLCLRSIVLEYDLFSKLCSHGECKDELLDSAKVEDVLETEIFGNGATYLQVKDMMMDMLYAEKKFDLTKKIIESVLLENLAPVVVVGKQSFFLYSEVLLPNFLSRSLWEEVNHLLFDIEFLCHCVSIDYPIEEKYPLQLRQLEGSIFYNLVLKKLSWKEMIPSVHLSINAQFGFETESDDGESESDMDL